MPSSRPSLLTLTLSATWLTYPSPFSENAAWLGQSTLTWLKKKMWIKISQRLMGYIKAIQLFNHFHISWNYIEQFHSGVMITVETTIVVLHQQILRAWVLVKFFCRVCKWDQNDTQEKFHHNQLIHSVITSLGIKLQDYNVLWLVSVQS